jgi:hypothetical protein
LAADGWRKTSEANSDYNCFAFALHDIRPAQNYGKIAQFLKRTFKA